MATAQGQAAGDEDTTHFGFKTVREAEKAGLVRQVFDSVASRYDLMNDLMSGGVHRLWKDAMVDALAPRADRAYLDVAGGTGDIAFRIYERTGRKAQVSIADINHEMLKVGRSRAADRGMLGDLGWVTADAQKLPLPDKSVDAYTIAFGLRNVTRIDEALAEARRVLRPGGRFLCLEFSAVVIPGMKELYDRYSFSVLPKLGSRFAGDAESYLYLAESIRQFPPQDELVAKMRAVGFEQVSYRNFSGGIAALHSGWCL
jgi:demethylmenaquinone methyltransferase / 2-methoxy-6-polyprenyl-1,4-benzoquinol methylase